MAVIVATVSYFSIAHWLEVLDAPDRRFAVGPEVHGDKIFLLKPFVRQVDPTSFAFGVERQFAFDELGDSDDEPYRSPIDLYEDGKRLGPAHSSLSDIAAFGGGRFSHLRKNGTTIYFSASDNTDPNTNGRAYWIVKVPTPAKSSQSLAPGPVRDDALPK